MDAGIRDIAAVAKIERRPSNGVELSLGLRVGVQIALNLANRRGPRLTLHAAEVEVDVGVGKEVAGDPCSDLALYRRDIGRLTTGHDIGRRWCGQSDKDATGAENCGRRATRQRCECHEAPWVGGLNTIASQQVGSLHSR